MIRCTGNMWDEYDSGKSDLFCITTNATIKDNGELIMGAGIAKQARDRFPGLTRTLGQAVAYAGNRYGLLVSPRWPAARIAAFQTKHHWQDKAAPDIIALSTKCLNAWCEQHPDKRVDLNFPGIGLGNLSPAIVLPMIEELSDQVHVWTYG